jgi:valyl-tRNA synthetase
MPIDIGTRYEPALVEAECQGLWEEHKVYQFDPRSDRRVFSVDTPPPYVSAAHLHVGHAMSYTQAEIIVRHRRMLGDSVFYPMGFDDNGLPTERYVEKVHGIDKRKTTRSAFRALCLEETGRGAQAYETLWRALGLSVDWRLRYSTIDPLSQRVAQRSFLELHRRGLIYRSAEPVLWDTHFETALAQADLETVTRKGRIYELAFVHSRAGILPIATTRPELLPACVALCFHPEDERYAALAGSHAKVPMFAREVPMIASEDVERSFGTGLMMVCTFGDGQDVAKWKRHRLETRVCIAPDGRMNELAGPYAGKKVQDARAAIVKDLEQDGSLLGSRSVEQHVSVAERSETPVEFVMAPQWFIRVLPSQSALLARSSELRWHPESMKVRLDQWIQGLKYDWNISRQRFYGVPFPVWFCDGCDAVVLAEEAQLPVDPLESRPPQERCAQCGGTSFRGDPDVMDTWMTSSSSPAINASLPASGGASLRPMSVRVQGFEIIRTWLFYTLVKAHLHDGALPWQEVMISGWGLNEQGKKISKRDLESSTDASGFNRYDPHTVIQKFGADALRYWAAGSHLGQDLRYNERDVRAGAKLVNKLWNAGRFTLLQLESFAPMRDLVPFAERDMIDRWVMVQAQLALRRVNAGMEAFDYAIGREALDRFFWSVYCDNYLEIVKDRFWRPELYSEAERRSAQSSLYEVLRLLLGMFAPYLPFVTEGLYQRIYRAHEDLPSLHATRWPELDEQVLRHGTQSERVEPLLEILDAVRSVRSERRISQVGMLGRVRVDVSRVSPEVRAVIEELRPVIRASARCDELLLSTEPGHPAEATTPLGLAVSIEA